MPSADAPRRVLRGGSYLCAACACNGFVPTRRMAVSPDTGLEHAGFRCVESSGGDP